VEGIVRGDLKPGESLPSVRQLGVDLGINLHTVHKAYSALEAGGFVKVYGRKGVVVASLPPVDRDFRRELAAQLEALFLEARGRGMGPEDFEAVVRHVLAGEGPLQGEEP
jgi:DNA-binding transcriptional regulator YhcF (GntR family)